LNHRERVLHASTAVAVALTVATLAHAGLPRTSGDKVPQNDEAKWNVMETYELQAVVPETEPNDTPTTADQIACGDVIRPAALAVLNDLDFYVFSATAGQLLTLGTDTNGAPDVDTYIYLVDNSGGTVLAQDDDNGPGTYSLISAFPAPYTGIYYLAVEAYDPTTETGNYQAFVNCAAGTVPSDCGITNYKGDVQTFPTPIAIPDNNLAGVNVGTINTVADGTRFLDVVVSLRATHTWVGDLVATLTYDETCDGIAEASSRFICRPGRATCDNTLGTPFGCSSNLSCNNTLNFSDAASNTLGLSPSGCGTSSTIIATGCYKSTNATNALSVFDNMRKGGCWKLNVADYGSGDLGTVCSWGVYTLNEVVVPVETTTWGAIKSLRFEN
jgi:subtilisin-like proprotein convertase family protein